MRSQRGARGRFSGLYGTTTLRLHSDFPYPPGGPRYERLVFDGDGQLIVGLNEWYRLMRGVGAARTRETYMGQCYGFGSASSPSMVINGTHGRKLCASTPGCS